MCAAIACKIYIFFRTNPLYVADQHSPIVSIETEIAAEQDNEGRKSSSTKFASRSAGSAHSSSSGYSSTSHSHSQRQDQEGKEDHTGWLL